MQATKFCFLQKMSERAIVHPTYLQRPVRTCIASSLDFWKMSKPWSKQNDHCEKSLPTKYLMCRSQALVLLSVAMHTGAFEAVSSQTTAKNV